MKFILTILKVKETALHFYSFRSMSYVYNGVDNDVWGFFLLDYVIQRGTKQIYLNFALIFSLL